MVQDTSRPSKEMQAPETSPSLQAALESLWSLLVEGERLEAWAVQHRLFALARRRIIVGATTGRLIVLSRRLISGFAPVDIRWQDLRDARLDVGIFGADLTVTAARGGRRPQSTGYASHRSRDGGRSAGSGISRSCAPSQAVSLSAPVAQSPGASPRNRRMGTPLHGSSVPRRCWRKA